MIRNNITIKTSELITTLNNMSSAIEEIYEYICQLMAKYLEKDILSTTLINNEKIAYNTYLKDTDKNFTIKSYYDTDYRKNLINSFFQEYSNDYLYAEYIKILEEFHHSMHKIQFRYDDKKYSIESNIKTLAIIETKSMSYCKINFDYDVPVLEYLKDANFDPNLKINKKYYQQIQQTYEKYVNLKNKTANINETNFIFDNDGNLLEKYKKVSLKDIDLSKINFNNKNIAGIDIHENLNLNINFDKIVKDLRDSNISGYNLSNYTFRNFDLTNCNMTNTGATIDLASCIVSTESKVNIGTLFDEDNKFIFSYYNTLLSEQQVEALGIKIYKKGK